MPGYIHHLGIRLEGKFSVVAQCCVHTFCIYFLLVIIITLEMHRLGMIVDRMCWLFKSLPS